MTGGCTDLVNFSFFSKDRPLPPRVRELLDRALNEPAEPVDEQVVSVVAADLGATLGCVQAEAMELARREARHLPRVEDGEAFELAEKVQQWLMDTFIDTTWPACPDHPNHPLWLSDDKPPMWTCSRSGREFCQLGQLATVVSPTPEELAAKHERLAKEEAQLRAFLQRRRLQGGQGQA